MIHILDNQHHFLGKTKNKTITLRWSCGSSIPLLPLDLNYSNPFPLHELGLNGSAPRRATITNKHTN